MSDRRKSNYDKYPVVRVSSSRADCDVGWKAIAERLMPQSRSGKFVVCVECYPGCFEADIERELVAAFKPASVFRANECLGAESDILSLCEHDLGDDPVFGFMNHYVISDFLDKRKVGKQREGLNQSTGLTLVIGVGASVIAEHWDLLVYCDMARWEIQRRQRAGEIANLGLTNMSERPALKYKRAFFVDWRAADRLKKSLLAQIDFLLDTNDRKNPKMISGRDLLRGLQIAAHRPFRVVPFFDPGPWGGQWMKEVCDLPRDAENYAWCFDCVPEENSLFLGFGDVAVEIPSIDLVFRHPRELLGDAVHARFGTEFPIRFDFLDTMDGGNLSFQVHPLTEYIQEQFGMAYTQDESYYMLTSNSTVDPVASTRFGIEAMTPLEIAQVPQAPGESRLPLDQASLLEIDGPDVNLSTWKMAEDEQGSVLRLQETAGRASLVHIKSKYFKFVRAWVATELEDRMSPQELHDGSVEVAMQPFQTLTLRVETESLVPQTRN